MGLLLVPFVSFLILFFFGRKLPSQGDWLATLTGGISFILSFVIFTQIWTGTPQHFRWTWFSLGETTKTLDFSAGILLDNLAAVMLVLVTFISLLIQVFSIAYMHGDKHYSRYFAYLGLFTAAMISIILADNLLLLFMGWELVGFASYLLIGFWFEKKAAAKASLKAFLINRLGDVGLLLGLFGLYALFQTFDLTELNNSFSAQNPTISTYLTLIGLGLFCGCIGKSAQFPLQVWLPDAMQGPTPVSALIHAATMVAAGVYLLARCYAFFTPDALLIIAIIGTLTALSGGLAALFQHDIKRILAYSTISQLGFMVMGMGTGNPEASLFHLITHAFFKAALFLIAGIVIHAMHQGLNALPYHEEVDRQDIRNMGGLRRILPITFIAYLLAFGGIVGLPFFSGFLSKDAILSGAWAWAESKNNRLYFLIPDIGFISVLLTAFYMTRQLLFVFFGKFRLNLDPKTLRHSIRNEASVLMLIPVVLLALLSLASFFAVNPFNAASGWLYGGNQLMPQLPNMLLRAIAENHEIHVYTAFLSTTLALAGIAFAWFKYRNLELKIGRVASAYSAEPLNPIARFTFRQFYLNELYRFAFIKPALKLGKTVAFFDKKVIDGLLHFFGMIAVVGAKIIGWFDRIFIDGFVNLLAWFSGSLGKMGRNLQGGELQSYYLYALLGLMLVVLSILVL
ncbi:NADH-quinone oxidoreductase subunit L [Adhaeribacter terrigena]|uniref:NADH-quinone oxidoreductase subunit L n=1 Tax=Adhaeribacter terrigena TaxID=2793070 RepID=UPI00293D239E|nr:NADH-quinone oxidoreductase subunit L [Adhaeribacter terrigena]